MPYRDDDVTEKLEKLSARIQDLENTSKKSKILEFLTEHHVPYGIGILVLMLLVGGMIRWLVLNDDEAASQEATVLTVSCQQLCSSMGLRGGVTMPWHDVRSRHHGFSCMCGNGMGGSVLVDPDGRERTHQEHPGPARTP